MTWERLFQADGRTASARAPGRSLTHSRKRKEGSLAGAEGVSRSRTAGGEVRDS